MNQAVVYRLEFSDGQVVITDGYGVVGRNPGMHALVEEIDGANDPVLVTIVDPTKSISRVHLVFGQFEGGFWVSDADSGNGTVLVYPDGNAYQCEPKIRYEVDPGSRIEFGAHAFTVTPA